MTEREKIGREIFHWIDKDPNYTRVLIPYALQIGAITVEEAEICKIDLEKYYKKKGVKNTHRDEVFMALMPVLGFSKSRILYQLVENLPKYHAGELTTFSHDESIRKTFKGMSTASYYKYIKELRDSGFIQQIKVDGKKAYKISFTLMDKIYNESKSILNKNGIT